MTTLILAVAISVFVSAFCSLLESILYSTRLISVQAAVEQGSRAGTLMKQLKTRVDRPLAGILILNTLANTAGAALAGWAAGRVFGAEYLWVFSLVFTLLILIFSEIIPKTVGAVYWKGLWQWSVFPLRMLVILLSPLIWLTRGMTRIITKGRGTAVLVSEDDILAAASLGHRDGEITKMEADLIHNIIGLEEISASDIMTPRTVMVAVDGGMRVSEILPEARNWAYSRLPVFEGTNENITGYVLKDKVLATDAEKEDPRLADISRPLKFMPASANALMLLKHFLSRRAHMCLVVDEYGGIDGLVTMEDVLESLVGSEIVDELDEVVDMQELARRKARRMLSNEETQD